MSDIAATLEESTKCHCGQYKLWIAGSLVCMNKECDPMDAIPPDDDKCEGCGEWESLCICND